MFEKVVAVTCSYLLVNNDFDVQLGQGPKWPKVVVPVLSFYERLQQEVNWWLQGVLDI